MTYPETTSQEKSIQPLTQPASVVIAKLLEALFDDNPGPICVAVGGPGGSGKSTFCDKLAENLDDAAVINLDAYKKTRDERKALNVSGPHPKANHFDLLESHLQQLKQGQTIDVPIRQTTAAKGGGPYHPTRFNILDGEVSTYPRFRPYLDFVIYLDSSWKTQLQTRITRDIDVRGLEPKQAITMFLESNLGEFQEYGVETKAAADIQLFAKPDRTIHLADVDPEYEAWLTPFIGPPSIDHQTAENSLSGLVQQYQRLTQTLADQTEIDPTQTLSCLVLRDQIAELTQDKSRLEPTLIPALAQADQQLKKLNAPITNLPDIDDWRASLNPPESAWWWHLSPPLRERILGIYERFDWVWDTLNIVVLTIIVALVFDIIPRFYRGGTDTTGAFAIVIQSVLTMVTAGGILTKTGAEAIERILKNYKVPKILWQEIRLGLALILLMSLILFRNQGLPALAKGYHQCGQQLHYEEGRLLAAQQNYERALELSPNLADVNTFEIQYDLGWLHENMQDYAKAGAKYQIAAQGNYVPAYNNLARQKIVVNKKYDEAVLLLLNGLNAANSTSESVLATYGRKRSQISGELAATATENSGQCVPFLAVFSQKDNEPLAEEPDVNLNNLLLYDLRRNLGWARLLQGRYREAKAELELAVGLKPDDAAAHCLLAQAIDELDREKELPNSLEAQAKWERCGQLANNLRPDEDAWIYQAQLAQLRPPPTPITGTVVVSDTTPDLAEVTDQQAADDDQQITPQPAENDGVHLLIVAEGLVKIKRQTWTDYFTTTVGSKLWPGDQIFPAETAKAIVLCDDLTTWPVPAGVASGLNNGCGTSPNPILQHRTVITPSHYREKGTDYPYLISPRATHILTTTPTFRWNPITTTDVVSYQLTLTGSDFAWAQTISNSVLTYTNETALTPGTVYTVLIRTNTGVTSHQPYTASLPIGFQIREDAVGASVADQISSLILGENVTPEAALVQKAKVENIINFSPTAQAKALTLAEIYLAHNLYAEALENLLPFAENGSAIIQRRLGDIHYRQGLPHLAKGHYEQALALATAADDWEGQALAYLGLANVAADLDGADENEWYDQAQRLYDQLKGSPGPP